MISNRAIFALFESLRLRFCDWASKKSGESHRPLTAILLKSIAIHLRFLPRYFCKSTPSPHPPHTKKLSTDSVHYLLISLDGSHLYRDVCRSTRIRIHWNIPKSQKMTKDLEIEGSRSQQRSVTDHPPLSNCTKSTVKKCFGSFRT